MAHPAPITTSGRPALRPYQREALAAIKRAYEQGVRRQLLVIPTGAGKTIVAACLPQLVGDPPLVYLAHRLELLEQTLTIFRDWRPDRSVGIERGDQRSSPADPTVVATVQSLSRPDRLARYRPEDWPLMVSDEAHRSPTDMFMRTFHHFRHLPDNGLPARQDGLLLGMTGTAKRTDNVGLGAVFQEVVFSRSLRDMIEDPGHYLVPLRGFLLRGGANLDDVRTHTEDGERDFDAESLARAVNTPERNRLVVDGTINKALAEGRPTLVFAANIAHGEALADLFRKANVRAANIYGEMSLDERRDILGQFKNRQLQVVVNCQLWLEGIDLPFTSAIVMGAPTKSSLRFQQAIGRGTRPDKASGKTDCIVIDFVDNTHKHATSLVRLPTLFGLAPTFDLRGRAAHHVAREFEDAAAALQGGIDADLVQRIRSPEDIPRVFYEVDLIKIAGLPPYLSRLTPFAWQRMPDGALSLTIPRPRASAPDADGVLTLQDRSREPGGLIEIAENALGHYEVRRRTGPAAPQRVAEHPGLEAAIRAADQIVEQQYGDRLVLLSKSAAWRQQPASPKQLRLLESLGQPIPRDQHGTVTLTKGQATLTIDRALILKRARQDGTAAVPPTPKQFRYMRRHRISIAPSLTKQDAQRLIGRDIAKNNRRRQSASPGAKRSAAASPWLPRFPKSPPSAPH